MSLLLPYVISTVFVCVCLVLTAEGLPGLSLRNGLAVAVYRQKFTSATDLHFLFLLADSRWFADFRAIVVATWAESLTSMGAFQCQYVSDRQAGAFISKSVPSS